MRRLGGWVLTTLACGAGFLAVIAGFNFALDPFHLFRSSRFYVKDVNVQRLVNAGLIRTERGFDALVVGSSYSANFNAGLIDSEFKVRSRVVAVYGGPYKDVASTLRYALSKHPDLRIVLVESPVWDLCGESEHPLWPLPARLYNGEPVGLLRPLLSKEPTVLALEKLLLVTGIGKPLTEFTDDVHDVPRWDKGAVDKFGRPEVLRKLLDPVTLELTPNDQGTPDDRGRALAECFRRSIATMVSAHPKVQFQVYNPPLYQWSLWMRRREGVLAVWNRAQELIGEAASDLPNLIYHDFNAAAEIVNDCSRYRDLAHFDPSSGDHMVRAMKRETYRRTPATNAALSARILMMAEAQVDCPLRNG